LINWCWWVVTARQGVFGRSAGPEHNWRCEIHDLCKALMEITSAITVCMVRALICLVYQAMHNVMLRIIRHGRCHHRRQTDQACQANREKLIKTL